MKKITVFGSYNGTSIGDTALLLGLLSSIERVYGNNVEVNVLAMNYIGLAKEAEMIGLQISPNEIIINKVNLIQNKTYQLLYRIKRKLLSESILDTPTITKALSGSHHLIIGGGNLIMDLFPEWTSILSKICNLSKDLHVDYSFLAVGAAPIDTHNGVVSFKKCLLGAKNVYYRDLTSKAYCNKNLAIKLGHVMPDLAFGLNPKKVSERNKTTVLFNIASYYGDLWPHRNKDTFHRYINGMVALASYIFSISSFDKLIIFNSNYPTDEQGSNMFYEKLKKTHPKYSIQLIDGRKSVEEIIQLGSTSSLAVTTRLHAGLMVAHGGCKVIGVAYQEKVKSVLEESKKNSYIIDIDKILDKKGFEAIVNKALSSQPEPSNYNQKQVDKVVQRIIGRL